MPLFRSFSASACLSVYVCLHMSLPVSPCFCLSLVAFPFSICLYVWCWVSVSACLSACVSVWSMSTCPHLGDVPHFFLRRVRSHPGALSTCRSDKLVFHTASLVVNHFFSFRVRYCQLTYSRDDTDVVPQFRTSEADV